MATKEATSLLIKLKLEAIAFWVPSPEDVLPLLQDQEHLATNVASKAVRNDLAICARELF